MQGTPKQIAWAEQIKAEKLAELEAMKAKALAQMPEHRDLIEQQMADYRRRLDQMTAAEWIDSWGYDALRTSSKWSCPGWGSGERDGG